MTDEQLLELLKSCKNSINENIIKILTEIYPGKKITIEDKIYKKYHNLLKLSYSIDEFLNNQND